MKTSEKPRKGTWLLVLAVLVLLFTILTVKTKIQTRIEYKNIKESCTLVDAVVSFAGDVTSGIKLTHSKHNYNLSYGSNQNIIVTYTVNNTDYMKTFEHLPVSSGARYFQNNPLKVYVNNNNRTIVYLESELIPPSILGIIGNILLCIILVGGLGFVFLTVRWGYDKIHGEAIKLAKKEEKEKAAAAAQIQAAEDSKPSEPASEEPENEN